MSARILPSIAKGRRGGCGALDWRKKGFEIRAEADAVSAMIFIRAENAVQLTHSLPPLHWHYWHCRRKSYTSSSHSLPPFHPTENMRHTLRNIRGRIIIYAHCVCLQRRARNLQGQQSGAELGRQSSGKGSTIIIHFRQKLGWRNRVLITRNVHLRSPVYFDLALRRRLNSPWQGAGLSAIL